MVLALKFAHSLEYCFAQMNFIHRMTGDCYFCAPVCNCKKIFHPNNMETIHIFRRKTHLEQQQLVFVTNYRIEYQNHHPLPSLHKA